MDIPDRLAKYAPVRLSINLDGLKQSELEMLPLLIEAARAMDDAFWIQSYGNRDELLSSTVDMDTKRYLQISYGPWDRLADEEQVIPGVGSKPLGLNFYPPDMTLEEFELAVVSQPLLKDPFTMVRRDNLGKLAAIPYHQFFSEQVQLAADKLRQAARLAIDPGIKQFLSLRSAALLTDQYRQSDMAWMDMKTSTLDLLIGPMETDADRLLWTKAAFAASVFIKDWNWTERLSKYLDLLPSFQENLPVPADYRHEKPGIDSDLHVYDAVYCAGYDNSSVPLGVNWPNDEEVRSLKGTKSLQIKNLMQAKYEKLLMPIASILISRDQLSGISFEGFFTFILFHEIAHGLGLKTTISGKGLVRDALKEYGYVIEELKADVVGLFIIDNLLLAWGDLSSSQIKTIHITSLADIFRRNGHSRQAMMRLNYFKELGAYSRDSESGTYRVHLERMPDATRKLAEKLLRFQGDGDYTGARDFVEKYSTPDNETQTDLERLSCSDLPLEIYLEQ